MVMGWKGEGRYLEILYYNLEICLFMVHCKEFFATVSSGFMTGSLSLCPESYKVGNYVHTYVHRYKVSGFMKLHESRTLPSCSEEIDCHYSLSALLIAM